MLYLKPLQFAINVKDAENIYIIDVRWLVLSCDHIMVDFSVWLLVTIPSLHCSLHSRRSNSCSVRLMYRKNVVHWEQYMTLVHARAAASSFKLMSCIIHVNTDKYPPQSATSPLNFSATIFCNYLLLVILCKKHLSSFHQRKPLACVMHGANGRFGCSIARRWTMAEWSERPALVSEQKTTV